MLSLVALYKVLRAEMIRLTCQSLCRGRSWHSAFIMMAMVLVDQVRSSPQRNLMELTLSTASSPMVRWWCFAMAFLKSMTISPVLLTFRKRLCAPSYSASISVGPCCWLLDQWDFHFTFTLQYNVPHIVYYCWLALYKQNLLDFNSGRSWIFSQPMSVCSILNSHW